MKWIILNCNIEEKKMIDLLHQMDTSIQNVESKLDETNLFSQEDLVDAINCYFRNYNEVYLIVGSFYQYVYLHKSISINDRCWNDKYIEACIALKKVEGYNTKINAILISLNDDLISSLVNNVYDKNLGIYIKRIIHNKRYAIGLKEDKIINYLKISIVDNLKNYYLYIMDNVRFKINGENVTKIELYKYLKDDDIEVRENAIDALIDGLTCAEETIVRIYISKIASTMIEAEVKGFNSALSLWSYNNKISREIVISILSSIKNYRTKIVRFLRRDNNNQRYELGSINIPSDNTSKNINFEAGKKIILELLDDNYSLLQSYVRDMFDNYRVDVLARENKRQDSFCYSKVNDMKPYILINYNNTLEDMIVLMHELGHGVHRMMASSQHILNYEPSLIISEMIAILFELLLINSDYINELSRKFYNKKLMLTIIDSVQIGMFEIELYGLAKKNIIPNHIEDIFFNSWKLFYDSIYVEKDKYKKLWLNNSHIIRSPFYYQTYAISNVLALTCYYKLKKNKNFLPKLIEVMMQGGTTEVELLLKHLDINITEEYVAEILDEFLEY